MLASRGLLRSAVNLTAYLVPTFLFGGRTAYGLLAEIDARLSWCRTAAETAAALNQSKPSLFDAQRRRFSEIEAQALTVKILNLWMSRHHFWARDARLLSHPFGLVVDPSNVCQLACPGCVHSSRSEGLKLFDWPNGTLTTQRFETLLQLYGPTAIAIYFCDYGEPLLNVNTPKLVRRAKMYLMATALSTSLSVRRFDPEAYVESGLDYMVLSIDGCDQAVYERFRRNGNLELVFENVRKLVEAKRRLGRTPRLSWNFLAFEHNAHQIPDAERMARRLGVNYFRVVNPFDVTWDDPEIRPARVEPRVRRLDWTSVSNPPENWNPLGDRLENGILAAAFRKEFDVDAAAEATASTGHTCHWLYKNMVMDATGRILPCCGAPRVDTQLVFGTLDGADADPFNSERHRRARALFRGDDDAAGERPYCANCEWDQTVVNIGAPEIRRYFRSADPWFFDRRSVRLLADW